jgi:endonuclease/exonuclease/phosphatase family metal-dependent hydrolase
VRIIISTLLFLLCSTHLQARVTEISVLTYNVFLRSPPWIFQDQHDWRTTHIPEFLRGYDAVVLQEAFSAKHRSSIVSALAKEYPYNSGVLGQDEFLSYNGGVIVLSRWPILKLDQLLFDACEGSDCMVQKGVIYASIEKGTERVHLFGLHLQAQKEYAPSRLAQFPQLQQFIKAQNIPESELVLVAGDFNVDYFSNDTDHEFGQLTTSLGLVLAEASPEPSYDIKSNTYVEDPVSERLDYIFYSSRHLVPPQASNQVLHFRKQGADLSDHHAVVGHFTIGRQL